MQWDPRALYILNRLEDAGFQTVLVGGCVRDSRMGIPPHDYDLATAARPHQIQAACRGLAQAETGRRYGTVTVFCEGLPIEVTTFRREAGYSDHRRPDAVAFTSSLAEDLARRDFTVNALAWGRGGLIDPHGGLADLEQRRLRCVGDPDARVQEDALRILRGLRFAAQLDFRVEPGTARALNAHAALLRYVARERIGAEFLKLACAPAAGRVLLEFAPAVGGVFPELARCTGFDQKNPHHDFDLYTHQVRALGQVPPDPVLRLAALLHDIGKPDCLTVDGEGVGHFYGHTAQGARLARGALERLRLPRALCGQVCDLIGLHHLRIPATPKSVGRWLSRLGEGRFFQWLALARADSMACRAKPQPDPLWGQLEALARERLAAGACLSRRDLAVDGRDALEAGLSGPAVGRALERLLGLVAGGELENDRDLLLAWLRACPGR